MPEEKLQLEENPIPLCGGTSAISAHSGRELVVLDTTYGSVLHRVSFASKGDNEVDPARFAMSFNVEQMRESPDDEATDPGGSRTNSRTVSLAGVDAILDSPGPASLLASPTPVHSPSSATGGFHMQMQLVSEDIDLDAPSGLSSRLFSDSDSLAGVQGAQPQRLHSSIDQPQHPLQLMGSNLWAPESPMSPPPRGFLMTRDDGAGLGMGRDSQAPRHAFPAHARTSSGRLVLNDTASSTKDAEQGKGETPNSHHLRIPVYEAANILALHLFGATYRVLAGIDFEEVERIVVQQHRQRKKLQKQQSGQAAIGVTKGGDGAPSPGKTTRSGSGTPALARSAPRSGCTTPPCESAASFYQRDALKQSMPSKIKHRNTDSRTNSGFASPKECQSPPAEGVGSYALQQAQKEKQHIHQLQRCPRPGTPHDHEDGESEASRACSKTGHGVHESGSGATTKEVPPTSGVRGIKLLPGGSVSPDEVKIKMTARLLIQFEAAVAAGKTAFAAALHEESAKWLARAETLVSTVHRMSTRSASGGQQLYPPFSLTSVSQSLYEETSLENVRQRYADAVAKRVKKRQEQKDAADALVSVATESPGAVSKNGEVSTQENSQNRGASQEDEEMQDGTINFDLEVQQLDDDGIPYGRAEQLLQNTRVAEQFFLDDAGSSLASSPGMLTPNYSESTRQLTPETPTGELISTTCGNPMGSGASESGVAQQSRRSWASFFGRGRGGASSESTETGVAGGNPGTSAKMTRRDRFLKREAERRNNAKQVGRKIIEQLTKRQNEAKDMVNIKAALSIFEEALRSDESGETPYPRLTESAGELLPAIRERLRNNKGDAEECVLWLYQVDELLDLTRCGFATGVSVLEQNKGNLEMAERQLNAPLDF
ncbi:unnamed protein product [Amoebophrya sp. A25]|nr:unnamed protein product [Amoebophrya sp. A25]|eukprot:GSA25T00023599001.1